MLFGKRRQRANTSNPIIAEMRHRPVEFAPDRVRADLRLAAGTRFFDPTRAAADQVGALLGVLRKARDWAAVRIESRLLDKVRQVSPDILFDLEKKLVFTSNVAVEALAFHDFAQTVLTQFRKELEAGDEEAAIHSAKVLFTGMLAFLSAVENVYHDYGSFMGRAVYERHMDKLNAMLIDDRRALEAFYSRFEVATARMQRIFDREVRSAIASGEISGGEIVRWVNALSECIERLLDSAALLVTD
jgi:hypothetical protein